MRLCECGAVAAVGWKNVNGERAICTECARKVTNIDPRVELRSLLRPIGDRVVVLPEPQAYRGLLILVHKLKEEHGMGRVLSTGPGATYRKRLTDAHWALDLAPMNSHVGDRVVYRRKHEGVVHDWRGLVVCHDFDVLAVVEEEEVAA